MLSMISAYYPLVETARHRSWRSVPKELNSPLFAKDREARGKSSRAPFSGNARSLLGHTRATMGLFVDEHQTDVQSQLDTQL